MNNADIPESNNPSKSFYEDISKKEDRKIKARNKSSQSVFFGLGMFGLIGWSVVIPTLVFTALGNWIDNKWPSPYSWTLMFLFGGLVLGCLHAWYWMEQTRKENEETEEGHE